MKEQIETLIQEHNEKVREIDRLQKEVQKMDKVIRKEFETFNKEETIKYYDQMEDGTVKFNVFLYIKKKFNF